MAGHGRLGWQEDARERSLSRRRRHQGAHDATVIERIRHWRARPIAGTWRDIARWLNAAGHTAPRGGPWHPATAQRIAARHGIE